MVDSPLMGAEVDAGFAVISWPIAGEYRVESVVDPPDLVISATAGGKEFWRPGVTNVASEVAALATASEEEIIEWVREWGFVGLEGDPYAKSERISAIREWTGHLNRCRQLLAALNKQEPDRGTLLLLARAAAGHIVGPETARGVSGAGDELLNSEWARPEAIEELQALFALGTALAVPLRRITHLRPMPVSRDGLLRLRPRIVAEGPLAAAYLETLSEAARLRVSWETGEPRVEWGSPRQCRRCGQLFTPKRVDSRYCGDRCRWAASKARQRRARRMEDLDE